MSMETPEEGIYIMKINTCRKKGRHFLSDEELEHVLNACHIRFCILLLLQIDEERLKIRGRVQEMRRTLVEYYKSNLAAKRKFDEALKR